MVMPAPGCVVANGCQNKKHKHNISPLNPSNVNTPEGDSKDKNKLLLLLLSFYSFLLSFFLFILHSAIFHISHIFHIPSSLHPPLFPSPFIHSLFFIPS